MNAPPVQYTMDTHSEQIFVNKGKYLRASAIGLLILGFLTGIIFSLEYFKTPPSVQERAQSASAAEILEARNAFVNVSLLAQGAIVADIDSGAVIYQKNADIQLPLASLTKV